MTTTTRRAVLAATAAFGVLAAYPAWADFPERAITVITPVGAGGGTDTHARALATALSEPLGVPLNVVNRPGAGGYVGAQEVVNSRADGYTLMVQSYGTFMMRAISKQQPVHPLEDFRILGVVGELYTGLVIRRDDERFNDLESFKAWAAENPNFTFGFSGNGSWHNAAAKAANDGMGIAGRPVVFKGGGATRAALLGGQTDIAWMGVQQLAGFEAQLTMLAVNSEERYPLATDIPTLNDLGIPYTLVTSPMVIAAPAGLPDDVASRLEEAVKAAATSESYKQSLASKLAYPRYWPPGEGRDYLQSLWDSWGPVAASIQK
ncbi:MAG: tripartite tricarboxylate transporter substrate binding protein [Pseudomonadota bacterium]